MAEKGSVGEIMRKDPVSLDVADRLDLVEEVLQLGRIRHLPILDRGRLVGIVSQRDLLARSLDRALGARARRAQLASLPVAEAMTRQPICVGEATPCRDAASLMIRHRIGCLPVLDGAGALVGIVSETDLLRAAYFASDGAS